METEGLHLNDPYGPGRNVFPRRRPEARVRLISDFQELCRHAGRWDLLSRGVPFRSWAWMSSWWRHYGCPDHGHNRGTRLFAVCIFNEHDELIGVAPWYLQTTPLRGRVLRFLSSGEVSSDYLSVLCEAGSEECVTEVLADWLDMQCKDKSPSSPRLDPNGWEVIELTGVDAEDRSVGYLLDHLEARGCTVHRSRGMNCWRLDLPGRWEDYLATLSRSRRELLRRFERRIILTGRASLHTVRVTEDLQEALGILIELHNRRRRSKGDNGSFSSRAFTSFHREVAGRLLRKGQLQLHWLDLDGKPAAAEYHLVGNEVIYAYQSGMEPAVSRQSPGNLITMALIRRAIENGYLSYDLLRGDEPYKTSWKARPRPSIQVRIIPTSARARMQHGLWLLSMRLKRIARRTLYR